MNAVLPVITELAGLIEGKVQSEAQKARERERRQQVEAEVARIVTGAAKQALANLEPDVQTLRDEITGQTIGYEAVEDLERARAIASDLVLKGESLLSSNAESPLKAETS